MAKGWWILVFAMGCSQPREAKVPPAADHAVTAPQDAMVLEIAARPLGLPDLGSFGWRKRRGHAAFRAAIKAEDRGDWPSVVRGCQEALTADPGHLEAAWLLAVGLAKTGNEGDILEPLEIAATGDVGKWAQASLDQPALQPFLATPVGQAWRRRVAADQQSYLAALARSIVVTASGDLFAYDPEAKRWHRLTHSWGGVLGALVVPGARRIAYVTRERAHGATSPASAARLGVGFVDLVTGKVLRPTDLGTTAASTIAYSASPPVGFWIGSRPVAGSRAARATWRFLDDEGRLHPLPVTTGQPEGIWLEALGRTARIHRLPVAKVSADWDDQSLASAIRIGTSNRVVSAPSPGLIDGNTATWSPDRARLAFVAIDDHCTPGAANAAAFVADAATGSVQELERAHRGLAVEWLTNRKLAISGDHGVSIVELGGGPPIALEGASDLAAPRRKPRCTPEPVDEPVEVDPGGPDEPTDAGTWPDAVSPH